MKLGLGTVQFGLDYGVSNRQGKTSKDEVRRMLDLALARGVEVLDTAALYGTSEEVLGECEAGSRFKIVTKSPQFKKDRITEADADHLERAFFDSLHKLRCDSVYGLLLHNCGDALTSGAHLLFEKLLHLQRRDLVRKVGVSVYSPEQMKQLLDCAPISLVQVPFNVFDQRFLSTGLFTELKQRHIEIHTRSVFLQGSLLMHPAELPGSLRSFRNSFEGFHAAARAHRATSLRLALGFVLACDEVDAVIVGACSVEELTEILDAAVSRIEMTQDLKQLESTNESLINPSRWSASANAG